MNLFGVGRLLSCLRGLDKVTVDPDWCPLDMKTDTLIEALEVLKLPHESLGLALDINGRSLDETDEYSLVINAHEDDRLTRFRVPPGNLEHR